MRRTEGVTVITSSALDSADFAGSASLSAGEAPADPAEPPVADEWLDPIEQMAAADRADRSLLRLVLCAAVATLLLALALAIGQ